MLSRQEPDSQDVGSLDNGRERGAEFFQREMIVAANQNLPIRLAQLFCSSHSAETNFQVHGFPHQLHVMARGKFKGKPKRGGNSPPLFTNDAYYGRWKTFLTESRST